MRRVLVVLMVGGCGVDLADMQTGASGAPPDDTAVSSTAASGGSAGTGGGEGTTPWQTTCLDACESLHECLGENLCVTRLDMNCIADPEPADPTRCLLECIANEPMMGCVDLALWW